MKNICRGALFAPTSVGQIVDPPERSIRTLERVNQAR